MSIKFNMLNVSPTLAALNHTKVPTGLSNLEIPFLSKILCLSSFPLINLYFRIRDNKGSKYLVTKK